MTHYLLVALAVLVAFPAQAQKASEPAPRVVAKQPEKRVIIFTCKLHTYRVRAYYCWEQ